MNKLFIEIFYDEEKNPYTSIESFLVFYVYNYLKCPENTNVIYIQRTLKSKKDKIQLNSDFIQMKNDCISENHSNNVSHLRLPVYSQGNIFISGLCAVSRELVKQTKNPYRKDLLGFKEGCLLSPAENSIWTKFCEIDITTTVQMMLGFNFKKLLSNDNYKIPKEISQFEAHMNQPIRVHNVFKIIKNEIKKINNLSGQTNCNDQQLKDASKNSNLLTQKHKFAEGLHFTLADLLLFPCFKILLKILPHVDDLKEIFPLTFKWMNEIIFYDDFCDSLFHNLINIVEPIQDVSKFSYIEEEIIKSSLYKCDPKRYKPKDRIYTKQESIDESLIKLATLKLTISSNDVNNSHNIFDWSLIADNTFPNFDDIPQSRFERKKQQLENVANAVISLAKDNDLIVDFCSGSGHLGILLAIALPNCHIIFLENKIRSLERAQQRVKQMNLKNCSFYQSNIDYFNGPFDIGTSLHACGTATDIVLKHCIKNQAKFVCCPCCYGSINPMPHISYPLSEKYKNILTEKNYLYIAHAADQFHILQKTSCNIEKCLQGEFCMDAIDTDRKIMAEEAGYNVILTRLKPENCTTKNRLLIGTILL